MILGGERIHASPSTAPPIFYNPASSLVRYKEIMNWTKEVVLIDSLFVPESSMEAFLQRVPQSAQILKTLPGFIDGFVYEKKSGDTDVNIVTTAVWRDEKAFENA